jgi:diguanylate cyclase (GGDEF)-like protein/PAS domain S-box-containing protein
LVVTYIILYSTVFRPLAGIITRRTVDLEIANSSLRQSEARYRAVAQSANDAIVTTDSLGNIVGWNPSAERMFGYAETEVLGQPLTLLMSRSYGDLRLADMKPGLSGGESRLISTMLESKGLRKDKSEFPLELSLAKWETAEGQFVTGIIRDITERKQMEDQVRELVFYDPLTKLPNRRLLNDRLNQAMAASKRSGCHGALMFLDLDNFKSLNDTHGHVVGDLLLIEAADRLKSCVREMDTVARFGGDEFVVMISMLAADKSESTTEAGIIAEKIRAALAKPYKLKIQHEGKAETTVEHYCTVSIGVALFIRDAASLDNVLKWADMAMYQAKEAGCNLTRFYNSKS